MEKNGIKINLVSLDAEFSGEQHIQNPVKFSLGKKSYGRLKFYANIVQQGINIQNFKFHVSDYNLRCTPHILILFFVYGYAHVSVLICTQVTMTTTTIISRFVY